MYIRNISYVRSVEKIERVPIPNGVYQFVHFMMKRNGDKSFHLFHSEIDFELKHVTPIAATRSNGSINPFQISQPTKCP